MNSTDIEKREYYFIVSKKLTGEIVCIKRYIYLEDKEEYLIGLADKYNSNPDINVSQDFVSDPNQLKLVKYTYENQCHKDLDDIVKMLNAICDEAELARREIEDFLERKKESEKWKSQEID